MSEHENSHDKDEYEDNCPFRGQFPMCHSMKRSPSRNFFILDGSGSDIHCLYVLDTMGDLDDA